MIFMKTKRDCIIPVVTVNFGNICKTFATVRALIHH